MFIKMAYITQYHWFSCNFFGSADIQPHSCTKMLILDKKIIFSRLAWQILNFFGTKIRKRVPHDMKPLLAKKYSFLARILANLSIKNNLYIKKFLIFSILIFFLICLQLRRNFRSQFLSIFNFRFYFIFIRFF